MRDLRNMTCIEDLRKRPPPSAARLLRLRRGRLLFRAKPARQPRRSGSASSCASGCLSMFRERDTSHNNPRRERFAPDSAGTDRHRRTSAWQWRDSRLSRRASRRHSIHLARCRSARSRTSPRRSTKPFWFQLYVMKDRGFARSLIERAAAAKCSALVLTVDLQVLGQRHADIKNGLSVPPSLKIGTSSTWQPSPAGSTACSPESAGPSAISPAM